MRLQLIIQCKLCLHGIDLAKPTSVKRRYRVGITSVLIALDPQVKLFVALERTLARPCQP